MQIGESSTIQENKQLTFKEGLATAGIRTTELTTQAYWDFLNSAFQALLHPPGEILAIAASDQQGVGLAEQGNPKLLLYAGQCRKLQ